MTAQKPLNSTTALARILTVPLLAGTLVACGYASRLPDAPTSVGGYQLADKPPSVTSNGEHKKAPPPPDAFAKLNAPVEYRAEGAKQEPALTPKDLEAPAKVARAPKTEVPQEAAFTPLEFEAVDERTAQVGVNEFVAPPMEIAPIQNPPAFARPVVGGGNDSAYKVEPFRPEAVEPVIADAAPVTMVTETVALETVPVESYAIAAAPAPVVKSAPAPIPSPVAILHTRMANGAVVNVHPVIGAPATASAMLARTVMEEIGKPVGSGDADTAPAVFDLRGRADRDTQGYVSAEWTLYDRSGQIVGVFSERQDGNGWKEMQNDSLRALGRRVADRINRNGELRQATLYAAAAPIGTAPVSLQRGPMVLPVGGELASAPLPRYSPRPRAAEPVRVAAAPRPAVTKPVAVKPAPVLKAPVQPVAPKPLAVAQAPAPRVAPVPVAPQVRSTQPSTLPSAPPPSFDTLRPGNTVAQAAPTVASGPRPLVFRGVSGAPGDGDQSLSREVAKLLAQSGANLSRDGGPGALFLTAQVKKTPTANADRIEIVWRVEDSSGASIGQVTQANDVPRGALDRNWGEDAYYAAEGAKTGIMELLHTSGALES